VITSVDKDLFANLIIWSGKKKAPQSPGGLSNFLITYR